jgi:hypothetical protein
MMDIREDTGASRALGLRFSGERLRSCNICILNGMHRTNTRLCVRSS